MTLIQIHVNSWYFSHFFH